MNMPETNPLRDNEHDAADWIASILGGSPCRRDIPSEQGKHDYDVVMPNGSTVALEVTRHISEADAEYTGITRGLTKRDWRSRDLANDWSVVVEMPSKGKRVGKRIHERLRQLQAQAGRMWRCAPHSRQQPSHP
ncbi:MAG: hypothetical protein F4Z28_16235 [Gammaproteobacteria bacterium]|nr:hypothetical protein [Gammaproteobacteria bacterium]